MKNIAISRRDFLKLLLSFTVSSSLSSPLFSQSLFAPLQENSTPNILIFLFDTLSAEHMSLFGYKRDTTPNLKKFADQSTVFHHHYSGGNWTPSGTASLLSGTYPWAHRSTTIYSQMLKPFADKNIFGLLNDKYYTHTYTQNLLANTILSQLNEHIDQHSDIEQPGTYYFKPTFSFTSNEQKYGQWSEFMLEGDFNHFLGTPFFPLLIKAYYQNKLNKLSKLYSSDYPRGISTIFPGIYSFLDQITNWAKNEIITLPQPFLSYFHFFAPHHPYSPKKEFVNIFNDVLTFPKKEEHVFSKGFGDDYLLFLRNNYDEFIANVDWEFHQIINFLEDSNLLETSYIILTSDHGEMFERSIWGHTTQTLYEPIIHIPLLIHSPGQKTRKDVYTPTSSVDILPTLCKIAGVEIPDWTEGIVLPGFSDESLSENRVIFSVEAKENSKWEPLTIGTVAMIKWPYKLIHYFGYPELPDAYELYNLEEDPEELTDLYSTELEIGGELKKILLENLEKANQPFVK